MKPSRYSQHQYYLLKSILNKLNEGVVVSDQKGKFLFFNAMAEEILGIGPKNVDQSEWTTIYGCYHPDKITPFPSDKLPLAQAIQGKEIINELIFIKNPQRPEGRFVEVSSYPLTDRHHTVIGASAILHDVTTIKQAEIEKQQSEAKIKAQFKGFPIPTYVWQYANNDFVLIDYNQAADQFTNKNARQFIGHKISELFADLPEVITDFHRCFHEKTTLNREMMSYWMRTTKQKKEMIFNYVYVPPDLIVLHTDDITEQKRNLITLKKLSNAVKQTADSVIITDKEGTIEYVNPAFEKTTGYSRSEALGKTPRLLKSQKHPANFYINLWNTILSGQSYRGTIINKKKNGEIYWSEQTITPMKDESGNITNFVSVLKDITERKQKEEQEFQLQLASEVQQRLNRKAKISVPGFDIQGINFPAVETSGDYFDFFWLADSSLAIVIGDVSGHGIGSALIMAETRAYLRSFAKIESDPAMLLNRLNNELVNDLDDGHYVTLLVARLFPQDKKMDYASAGHLPSFHFNGEGELINTMESTGIPLGIIKNYQYQKSDLIQLEANDIIASLTDGISEAHNAQYQQFGFDRTCNIIRLHKKDSAKQIIKRLYQEVRSFSNATTQEDDITSIICKVQASNESDQAMLPTQFKGKKQRQR